MAAADGRDPVDEQPEAPPAAGLDAMVVRESARAKLFGARRAKPVAIDRYLIQRGIGAGGMGEVFVAWDPELARKVAIKLVHRAAGGSDADANARLLREARALAQLDHPSIVPIHDVGTLGDRIWLAMEYIDGETLRQWLRTPRRRDAILAVLVRAGRGLAAAHARGILHRDFKPDNVMVAPAKSDPPTHVRVTDFGLARWIDGGEPTSAVLHLGDSRIDLATRTNAVLGTIGYIAPELLSGGRPSEASDQFAFCVTAFEALSGGRPFGGKTPQEVAVNTLEGRTSIERKDELPRWIRSVLERGLALAPSSRHASMDALLDELDRDPVVKRRRMFAWGGAAALAGAVVASAWLTRGPTCTRDESRLAGVWDDDAKRSIASAFAATNAPYAEGAWTSVEPMLDAYAAAWLDARVDACRATHVLGEQSADLLDLRVACLDVRMRGLAELTAVLRDSDADIVRNAVKAAGELQRIHPCADVTALRSTMPPVDDPALAAEVADVQTELARARANSTTGRYAVALDLGREARDHAIRVGHRPTMADAQLELGITEMRMGDLAAAETDLRAAVWDGEASHHDRAAARAAAALVGVVGYGQRRPERAEEWADHARSLLDRVGDDDVIEGTRLSNLAIVRDVHGRVDEGRELHARALALRRTALGPDHQSVCESLVNLGADALVTGDIDGAEAHFREALATYERTLGPRHPEIGGALSNLAVVALHRGRHGEAAAQHQRAVDVLEPVLGPEHFDVLLARNNLALALARSGRAEDAVRVARDVVSIGARTLAADHPELARFRRVLGEALLAVGDAKEARDELAKAVEQLDRIDDPTANEAHVELARAMARTGDRAAAIPMARAAIARELAAHGPEAADALVRTEIDACDPAVDGELAVALREVVTRGTP